MAAADGSAVVIKVYPDGRGAAAFRNMDILWRSPFGDRRRPPGLPKPIEYVPDPDADRGALVMERLRDLDKVAYVRFASVYREFTDVGDFVEEIQPMLAEEKSGNRRRRQ